MYLLHSIYQNYHFNIKQILKSKCYIFFLSLKLYFMYFYEMSVSRFTRRAATELDGLEAHSPAAARPTSHHLATLSAQQPC